MKDKGPGLLTNLIHALLHYADTGLKGQVPPSLSLSLETGTVSAF